MNLCPYGSTAFGTWSIFQFLNPIHSRQDSLSGDQPVTRPPLTHRAIKRQNKGKQIPMTRGGFEPMIPAFERAETVHSSDSGATVVG
jgi:hypothetical protein